MVFLEAEEEKEIRWRTAQEYYWAQIACMIVRANCTSPGAIKSKDFLIELKPPEDQKTVEEIRAERTKQSKQAWAKACNLKLPKE